MRERLLVENKIRQEDVDSIHVCDEPERVRDIVLEYHRIATGELPAHRVEEPGTRWRKR